MGWFKDFWDAGPFSGPGTPYDGGGKYDKDTADVARENRDSYDNAARTRDDVARDVAKGGLGPRSSDGKEPKH